MPNEDRSPLRDERSEAAPRLFHGVNSCSHRAPVPAIASERLLAGANLFNKFGRRTGQIWNVKLNGL